MAGEAADTGATQNVTFRNAMRPGTTIALGLGPAVDKRLGSRCVAIRVAQPLLLSSEDEAAVVEHARNERRRRPPSIETGRDAEGGYADGTHNVTQ